MRKWLGTWMRPWITESYRFRLVTPPLMLHVDHCEARKKHPAAGVISQSKSLVFIYLLPIQRMSIMEALYMFYESLPYTVGRDWSQGYLLLRTSVMETSTVPHDEYSGPSTYVRGYHRLPQEDSPFSNRHKVPREPYPGVVQSPPPYCDPGPQSSPYAPAPQSFNAQQSSNVSNT